MAKTANPITFSNKELNRAGASLREAPEGAPPDNALKVLQTWRAAHQKPLNAIQMWLRSVIKSENAMPIVAQRLKRVPSIVKKLKRFPTMGMSSMQDVGGCRIICRDRSSLTHVVRKITKSRAKHERKIKNDYIASPKNDGYRGIHIVARYKNNNHVSEEPNSFRVEVQVRSKAQHAWATAVETVDLFQNTGMKSGNQSSSWAEFFLHISDCIAYLEDSSSALINPHEISKQRAHELYKELRVGERLKAYRNSLKVVGEIRRKGKEIETDAMLVLVLNTAQDSGELRGYIFPSTNAEEANRRYLEEEQRTLGDSQKDVVLVSALGIDVLRNAYPNYFLDTRIFIQICEKILNVGETQEK